eukprot:CAMPEP_0115148824 /NCGR_PEP_ID=MMETSP0227-20121206/64100_1 /TAXON_ID=89957 /ORGANISM="Polarella glacialis, Strain CCMP 1383" /LENGTH=81 /DNA_ID=CAMNT_0002558925 /DNA_START=546 /DNA_END=791 /DNA_ORIENTATION=+
MWAMAISALVAVHALALGKVDAWTAAELRVPYAARVWQTARLRQLLTLLRLWRATDVCPRSKGATDFCFDKRFNMAPWHLL